MFRCVYQDDKGGTSSENFVPTIEAGNRIESAKGRPLYRVTFTCRELYGFAVRENVS